MAFVAAVTYLLQLRALKRPGRWFWARQLPSLETLETLQRRTAVVGLVLMTGALADIAEQLLAAAVITSYSIHYTKLYECSASGQESG